MNNVYRLIAILSVLLISVISHSSAFAVEVYNLAVDSYPTPSTATLTWQRRGKVNRVQIQRRLAGVTEWQVLATVPANVEKYVDRELMPQRRYDYRVVDADNLSSSNAYSSSTVQFFAPEARALVTAYNSAASPRQVDAQAVSRNEVVVTWDDVTSDELSFKIERRQGSIPWSPVGRVPANVTIFRDVSAVSGTYEYRVVAERAGLEAIASESDTALVGANDLRYVDGCIDNNFPGDGNGSLENPWKNLQSAAFALTAGQTLLVRNRKNCSQPTVYRSVPSSRTGAHNLAVLSIGNDAGKGQFATGGTRSGTPSAWITYRNYPGERPKIRTTRNGSTPDKNGNFHGISVRNASYIVVEGFEIVGHLSEVQFSEAQRLNSAYKSNRDLDISSVLDSSGVTIGNGDQSPALRREIPHHIIIRNNIVHGHPGGGINALYADYVIMEKNIVHNVGDYSPYGASGINIYRAKDIDNNRNDYKLIVRENIVYDARNLFPCRCVEYEKQTDGNGIILDQLDHTKTQTTEKPIGANPQIPPGTYTLPGYKGKALIINNIVHRNGGRGIHVFQSSNADILFNTAYLNSQITATGDGEITAQNARKVRAYNNILYASADRPTHWITFASLSAKAADSPSIDFNHNVIFGGNPAAFQVQVTPQSRTGALRANNRIGADPRFAAVAGGNAFQLLADSPALNAAWIGGSIEPPIDDVFGAPRPRGSWMDVGAVESF